MTQINRLNSRIVKIERERDELVRANLKLLDELRDTQDALHVMMTAAKRDPDAAFEWPDRNERIGLVLAKAAERANLEVDGRP